MALSRIKTGTQTLSAIKEHIPNYHEPYKSRQTHSMLLDRSLIHLPRPY